MPVRREAERELTIVDHGGCGGKARGARDGVDNHSLRKLSALRYTRQLNLKTQLNKMG